MAVASGDRLRFLWLEVTSRCQLRCSHCYSSSGPAGDHGNMTTADWRRVLDQAAELDVSDVQFIGGEPTLHPDLPDLVRHALGRGLGVEVYSNLARVTDPLWELFSLPGVTLATSYYSRDSVRHDAITGRRSHDRTLASLREAVRRGIPIRVGLVEIEEVQHIDGAIAELRALGIDNIRVDRLRQVGRGVRDQEPGPEQLCGRCADGSLAVLPTGEVLPCVLARWMVLGDARCLSLPQINQAAVPIRAELRTHFAARPPTFDDCDPKTCQPCDPNKDGDPGGCDPDYKDLPKKT
jgi:sulfatase maturation enzyme AslB (radical SAM superfamily)